MPLYSDGDVRAVGSQPHPASRPLHPLLTAKASAELAGIGPRSRARLRITGAAGSGRSTLIKRWLTSYRERYPDTFVFVHTTDGRADNRDPAFLSWRLLDAVKSYCQLRDPVPHDADIRREALPNWLARATAQAGALIVIDGCDGFDPGAAAVPADIVPRYQPPGLNLVITDFSHEIAGEDDWHTLYLHPLQRAALTDILSTRVAALPVSVREAIVRAPPCANPLFLHTLLDVPIARRGRAVRLQHWLECSHPQALFDRILETLEAELEDAGVGPAPMIRVLRLLWAARDALDADALRARLDVPQDRWRILAAALAPLVVSGDAGGWRLPRASLRRAVAARYLRDGGQRQAAYLALAQWLAERPPGDSVDTDLPWYLARAGQTGALRRHLSDPRVLTAPANGKRRFELHSLWQQAGTADEMAAACRATLPALNDAIAAPTERAHAIIHIAGFLHEAGTDAGLDDFYARAQTAIESDPASAGSDRAAALLAHGAYLNARGDLQGAEPLLRAAHAVLAEDAAHELAILHEARGELAAAETLYRATLTDRERKLGDAHPDLLPHLANLAAVLRAGHRFEDAEPLCRRALAIAETRLGDEHPTTSACIDRLAALRYAVHDYEQAEALYRRGLVLSETIFGPHHPATAAALHNLGTVMDARDAFREAEALHRRALGIREAALGTEHEDTATSLHNLAAALDAMGRYNEAEPLYRRAIAVWESLVGENHPATATSVNNLADLLREQHQFAAAEGLYRRNIETWRGLVGEDHPNTLTTLIELAGLYADTGRSEQAEPLLWHGVEVSEQVMGPTSLVHINAVCKLAALLRDDGRRDAARILLQKTCAAAEDTLDMISPRLQKLRRQLEALDRDG